MRRNGYFILAFKREEARTRPFAHDESRPKLFSENWGRDEERTRPSGVRAYLDKVLDILDAQYKCLQAEWDASYKRFYEQEEQERIERPKKAKRVQKQPRKESSGPERLANCQLL
jgi:hypothetical protein